MHDQIALSKQHPTQNFHKNLKKIQKPQKFQRKPKNLGLMKCMRKEGFGTLTREEMLDLGRNARG